MKWSIYKEQYQKILHDQITANPVKETIEVYEQLLKNGYDEDQAIDKMTPYMHDYAMETMITGKNNEALWTDKILPLKEDVINDLEYVDRRKLNQMLRKIKKEFGTIERGAEYLYEDDLYEIEHNLYIQSQMYYLNSRQIKDIVMVWIVKLYGLYHDTDYDLSYTINDDLIEMTKPLVYICNPYINEEIKKQFIQNHPDEDLNTLETKKNIYEMNFRLLNRILDSIEFWNKEYGSNGYLNYLNHFMED